MAITEVGRHDPAVLATCLFDLSQNGVDQVRANVGRGRVRVADLRDDGHNEWNKADRHQAQRTNDLTAADVGCFPAPGSQPSRPHQMCAATTMYVDILSE